MFIVQWSSLLTLIAAACFCVACTRSGEATHENNKSIHPEWNPLFSDSQVRGVSIIKRIGDSVYHTNSLQLADTMVLPASTFKIPNTLIGLELGLIDSAYVFKWDGRERWNKAWSQDLILAKAFRYSCVPCYQDLARRIGDSTMRAWLDTMSYGNENIGGGLDQFWLVGDLRISPRQQIDFLERLSSRRLGLSSSTYNTFESMFVIDTTATGVWSGKTGMAVRDDEYHGWFVAWIDRPDGRWLSATLAFPEHANDSTFGRKRSEVARRVFQHFIESKPK